MSESVCDFKLLLSSGSRPCLSSSGKLLLKELPASQATSKVWKNVAHIKDRPSLVTRSITQSLFSFLFIPYKFVISITCWSKDTESNTRMKLWPGCEWNIFWLGRTTLARGRNDKHYQTKLFLVCPTPPTVFKTKPDLCFHLVPIFTSLSLSKLLYPTCLLTFFTHSCLTPPHQHSYRHSVSPWSQLQHPTQLSHVTD